ncbi:cation-translocating P-type ATPase [Aminipila butyrica]|uniref:Cation-translocating P-type ATPase n=1 Tax=Aminipila butyrica TaxID=433296 RepID=A0A858BYD3_9FIRM|nr:cation-translocating P-type ATPase [Aminipila butyrica]QIB70135.1 cation-translocating P-type ATPase [Aminipila butyrica]
MKIGVRDMFYKMSTEETLEQLNSSKEGLNEEQIKANEEKYGLNQLAEERRQGVLSVFFSQFKDLLVLILLVAAAVSIFTGDLESTLVILVVIVLNAVLGTAQHFKAEMSLNSLKKLSSPLAKVMRGGHRRGIEAAHIVVGDILVLEAGDVVPADGRLLESYSLQVNESSLTGETESVSKITDAIEGNVVLGDQDNMVFSGTQVTYGRGLAVVTGIGMNTELGKIAQLMNETKERKTPLQVSLDAFGKKLSFIILIICAGILGLCIYRGMDLLDSLMFAVALAVAAIPEALSSIVTISLALGTSKMAKENAIMKNLKAVESLGCVSIICSDKTGTLTRNKMTVRDLFLAGKGEDSKERLLLSALLCNDSSVTDGKVLGDPTETALVEYYLKEHGENYAQLCSRYPRIAELPFDSDRKLMSTLQQIGGELVMLTKGAVDAMLHQASFIYSNGQERPITQEDIQLAQEQNHAYSEKGLRVLAFAQKKLNKETLELGDETDFTFIGLMAMQDPPREESKAAVADCLTAGIMPVMITGDHKVTASAIAEEVGILRPGQRAVTGMELDEISDQQLDKDIAEIAVYARVTPAHKIRIVDAWQKKGHIVAMTGDGVNDAPALKKADIGVAMGITGTDVSKDAASMILTDDNFATIVKAIANGRNIYSNIKNSIKFLLSGNTSGILAVVYTSLMALPIPFMAVHLLFINLITDSLPAIAISMEKPKADLLQEPPRRSDEPILTKNFLTEIGIQGLLIAAFTLAAYYQGLTISTATASTMAFATLCFARLWHGFNSRGKQSIFKMGLLTNVYSLGAFALGTLLLFAVLLIDPLQSLFQTVDLSQGNLTYVVGCALAPTVLIQLSRVIRELTQRKTNEVK